MLDQLEQLKELLEMQRVLDDAIFKEHGITEYPLENMKLALFDELGELLHEFPTQYKHWKKNAVDNREKGLEEYVDVLHFALSLANHFEIRVNKNYIYEKCKYDTELSYILHDLYSSVCRQWENSMMYDLFVLGNYFGFSWEEIYTAYKEKNAINYQRIRDGY